LVDGREKEYDRVTAASRAFNNLANKLDIPIVCLHQLNRSNLNNRPTMNELRSSGQLEQDADVIILLHRQKEEDVEKCELIIEKNRHGRTGIINATWNGPINRIENTHYEHQ
jgi:replicative DNA helicase